MRAFHSHVRGARGRPAWPVILKVHKVCERSENTSNSLINLCYRTRSIISVVFRDVFFNFWCRKLNLKMRKHETRFRFAASWCIAEYTVSCTCLAVHLAFSSAVLTRWHMTFNQRQISMKSVWKLPHFLWNYWIRQNHGDFEDDLVKCNRRSSSCVANVLWFFVIVDRSPLRRGSRVLRKGGTMRPPKAVASMGGMGASPRKCWKLDGLGCDFLASANRKHHLRNSIFTVLIGNLGLGPRADSWISKGEGATFVKRYYFASAEGGLGVLPQEN